MSSSSETDSDYNELLTAWMGTAASQIFIMQLGFLLFETGMVDPMWSASIIIKNLEDTWVGILAYMMFGWTMTSGNGTFGGVLGTMKNTFLIGVPHKLHEEVFIAAMFATTTATIMSGCILERMKNKGYIVWCFLIVAVNYSIISHWVWNPRGWLYKMGFIDCAGSSVVHMVGGVGALTSSYFLGPRHGSVDEKTGKLKKSKPSERPILVAMGTFILWYGWFAFNIASPIAADMDIRSRLGTVGLNTCVSPAAASFSCFLIMYKILDEDISFEHLVSCVLAGLVCITASAMTVPLWAGYLQGFLVSFVYFGMVYVEREWMMVDDPLAVGPVHLWGGCTGIILEGVFADDKLFDKGLVFGGFEHFGVQCLGCVSILAFTTFTSVCLWYLMDKVIFRVTDLRVSPLDTYLGTQLFKVNPKLAFQTLVECKTNSAYKLLLDFHKLTLSQFCNERLDFLVAIQSLRQIYDELMNDTKPLFREQKSIETKPDTNADAQGLSANQSGAGVGQLTVTVELPLNTSSNPSQSTPTVNQKMTKASRKVMKKPSMGISFEKPSEEDEKKAEDQQLDPAAVVPRQQYSEQERILDGCMKHIMKLYLFQDSEMNVNLTEGTRCQIRRAADSLEKSGHLMTDIHLFDRCYDEVMNMLEPDFKGFLERNEEMLKKSRIRNKSTIIGCFFDGNNDKNVPPTPTSLTSSDAAAGVASGLDGNMDMMGSIMAWFKGGNGSSSLKSNKYNHGSDVEMGSTVHGSRGSFTLGSDAIGYSDDSSSNPTTKKIRANRIPYWIDIQWRVIWDGEQDPTELDKMSVIFYKGRTHGYYTYRAIRARVSEWNSGNVTSGLPVTLTNMNNINDMNHRVEMAEQLTPRVMSPSEENNPAQFSSADVSEILAGIDSAPPSPTAEDERLVERGQDSADESDLTPGQREESMPMEKSKSSSNSGSARVL